MSVVDTAHSTLPRAGTWPCRSEDGRGEGEEGATCDIVPSRCSELHNMVRTVINLPLYNDLLLRTVQPLSRTTTLTCPSLVLCPPHLTPGHATPPSPSPPGNLHAGKAIINTGTDSTSRLEGF